MADWVINALENDGYPYLLELGKPPQFSVNTLFVEPKPRNIWVINVSANDGYPFINWQFDFTLEYQYNRPYYRGIEDDTTSADILFSCGHNNYGQLGLGNEINTDVFIQVDSDIDWADVQCGYEHTFGLKSDGTLWSCGRGQYGRLGLGLVLGVAIDKNTLTKVGTDTDWVQVKCGYEYTFALKSNGTLWSCGDNDSGQLGHGVFGGTYDIFTKAGIDTDWVKAECSSSFSSDHTFALKSNGTLWSCGRNNYGQLGLGDVDRRNVFTQVGSDTDWADMKCGSYHTFALKSNGTLWSCGLNSHGQLGLGDENNRNVFTQVGVSNDWSKVSCGTSHSFALKSNGTLWSCGRNIVGELGLGDESKRNVLTQVGSGTDWDAVGCGSYHTFALKSNGTLWSCGYNIYGQLGLGDESNRNVFTENTNINECQRVNCGGNHAFILKSELVPTISTAWKKLLRLYYYNGTQMKRAYRYRFWNGTRWV